MENNENTSVLTLIKQKFLASQSAIKSVKQLDFYISRGRTANDKLTAKKFTQFLKQHQLTQILKQAGSDATEDENSKSLTEVKALLESIEIEQPKKKKNDQVVLEQVLKIYRSFIESGEEFKFKKPWVDHQVLGLPKNAKSGEVYLGGNDLLLSLLQGELGLDLPFFLNRSNIEQLNLDVPSECIAVCQKVVELYVHETLDSNDPEKWISTKKYKLLTPQVQEIYRQQKIIKQFDIYHHSQFTNGLRDNEIYQSWIENYKETKLLKKLEQCRTDEERQRFFDPKIYAAKCVIDASRKAMGIDLIEHPTSCHYSPAKDQIAMVSEQNFITDHPELVYTGAYCHELSHSTGHEKRLKRNLTGNFGSSNYGMEELCAESSSLQLLKRFNLPSVTDKQSAAYIANWLKTQQDSGSKDFLSIGCHQGSNAADFILTKAKEYQAKLVENLDIEQFRISCLSKDYSNVDTETLFIAHYINNTAIKAINKFLNQRFNALNEVERLLATGKLLSSSKEQFLLDYDFRDFLKKEHSVLIFDATQAGRIVSEYSLNDIFNTDVDVRFDDYALIKQFHASYGKDKITEYLNQLEIDGVQLKGDAEAVDMIRELTDKQYLFDVSDKPSCRRKITR